MGKRLPTLIVILFFLIGTAAADDKTITLNECINIAVQGHPNLMVSLEDRKKAMADYRVASASRKLLINGEFKSIEYPKSTASAQNIFNIPGVDTDIGLFAGIAATYSIYNAKKSRQIEMAECSIKLSKFQSRKVLGDVIYGVKEAYYQYLIAKENLSFREKLVEKNKEKLKVAEQLFRGGTRMILDVSKAKVNLSEAQLDLDRARNQERIARLNLYTSMGINDSDVVPQVQEMQTLPELKYTVTDLFKMAENYDPDIQIMSIQKEMSRLNIAIEKAQRYPEVNFNMGFGYENRGLVFNNLIDNFKSSKWKPTFHASVDARMPLYSAGFIKARVEAAESEYRKTVYRHRDAVRTINAMIRSDYMTLSELVKQMSMSRLVRENAEKHLQLAQRLYQNGETSQLELQDAQVSLINAEMGYLNIKYRYLITIAKLSKVVGVSEDNLCQK